MQKVEGSNPFSRLPRKSLHLSIWPGAGILEPPLISPPIWGTSSPNAADAQRLTPIRVDFDSLFRGSGATTSLRPRVASASGAAGRRRCDGKQGDQGQTEAEAAARPARRPRPRLPEEAQGRAADHGDEGRAGDQTLLRRGGQLPRSARERKEG